MRHAPLPEGVLPRSIDDTPLGIPAPRLVLPPPGKHAIGVARISLKRVAAPAKHTGPAGPGRAQPCDRTPWSRGLYGVFLPDRRASQLGIGFSDRRSA